MHDSWLLCYSAWFLLFSGIRLLIRYNPLIDWVSGSISFQLPFLLQSPVSISPVETLVNPLFSSAENPLQFTPSETFLSKPKWSHIAIINAPALLWALRLSGLTTFSLQFHSTMQAKSTTISKKSTSLPSQRNTTSMLMFLASPKQRHLLPTVLMTSGLN